MGYLGRNPAIGTQKVLDSLESQFDGSLTTFDLRYNGVPTYPTISSSLIVSLGGVLQEPGEAYYVSSDTIVFASAPTTGSDCWILLYSEYGAAAGSGSSGGAVSVATGEPMGHEDRTDSAISFDNATRTFTIEPASGVSEFAVWTKGIKRTYSTAQTVQISQGTGLYYIYFDAFGVLQYRTTYFIWDEDTPTAYVYWNATTSTAVFVADERHGIVLDWQTHEYLHRTRGAVIANGFSISNYTTTGDGSADADAQFDLGNGTFFDEDLEVGITHSATPSAGTFTQVLTGNAEIPVYYMSGSEGDWVRDTATEFACKQSATTLQWNRVGGSTWSTASASDNRYVVSWVVATNEISAPVIAILGQDQYSSIGTAEEAVWGDLTLTNFPIVEFRPLWKIIFRTNSGYTNTPNAYIANVLDLREFSSTGIAGTIVNDHGLLSGLADDDHAQYLHASVDRTGVTANISTTGNITAANLIATGQLQGPANFVIDPAAVGDDTGTVEIKGNLTVQGTQTTVNSTTVDLDHLSLGDNEIANFGNSNDLQIYHNGSHSYISESSGTGDLRLVSSRTLIRDENDANHCIIANSGGSVDLYHNGSVKFATTSDGVQITGRNFSTGDYAYFSTNSSSNASLTIKKSAAAADAIDYLQLRDSNNALKLKLGGDGVVYSPDVLASHEGDTDTRLRFPGNDIFAIETGGGERFRANSSGVTVTGALEVSAATNITVGGTALPSLTGLLGGSLSGTLGTVTMAYLPSAPSSPVQGQFYFDSLNQKAQIYTGSSFVDLVPSGGGGGGGAGTTDAQATFRKYTYTLASATNAISGSSDTVVSDGDFVVGNVYTIKTVGTTDFTAIGASANTVGVEFTATGNSDPAGTGDAYDTLYYATGGIQNIEVYVNGVKAVEGSTNDYVATTGTSVNFTANLASGDVVDVQVYELLTNDAYVLASGGTFTGNVGINTSTINNRLHIHNNANDQGILLTQDGSNYSSVTGDANRTGADESIIDLKAKWNGTLVSLISLESGDDTTNKDDGRINFWTSAAGGSLENRLSILPNGNVGIGTTDPTTTLEVTTSIDGEATLATFKNTSAGGTNETVDIKLGLENTIASNVILRAGKEANHGSGGATDNFFAIHTTLDNASSEKLRISSTGNVGIGTNNPPNKLSIWHSTGSILKFRPASDFDGNYVGHAIDSRNEANSVSTTLLFRGSPHIWWGDSGTNEIVRFTGTGNVGIGTTNPSQKLVVYNGNIKLQGEPTNVANLIFTRTDTSWSLNNETEFRIYSGSGTTDSPSTLRLNINHSTGHITPGADATQDFGSPTKRWANIYSADLQLSNEGSANEVDGTWGAYTIQEGEEELFLINRRSGKKFKFVLEEVKD